MKNNTSRKIADKKIKKERSYIKDDKSANLHIISLTLNKAATLHAILEGMAEASSALQ